MVAFGFAGVGWMFVDGSHAPRGNPSGEVLRPAGAERLWLHALAEYGHDHGLNRRVGNRVALPTMGEAGG